MTRAPIRTLMHALAGAAALSAVAAAAHAGPALAGGPRPYRETAPAESGSAPGVLRVELSTAGPASRTLALGKGKSALVELPVDARDVTVTSPAIADVVLRTPRRISVLGLTPGDTDAVFFDGMGRTILSLDIRVDQDGGSVAQTIEKVLPGSHVEVQSVNNSLILTGLVRTAGDADKAQKIAEQFVSKPELVLNMLSIAGKDQVMLKVRVVEVQRTAIKQLGFNLNAVIGQLGGNQWTSAFAPTWGVSGQLLGGLTGGYTRDTTNQPVLQTPCSGGLSGTCYSVIHGPQDAANWNTATSLKTAGNGGVNSANSMIQAFERAGLVRTLAEPNLTAVSGEAANFLVGGEFPVPTGQDTQGRVTIEFKPFGVGLGFTPVVLSGGRISLKLSTEVSELTSEGSFNLTSGSGAPTLVVPALAVRRAETTVELPSGGALMIAGLLQNETKQTIDSVPGLINVPILGTLFRSRDYQNGETELVIIVTPYLVNPVSPNDLQTPADGLEVASDAQTILMGRLNRAYKAPADATTGRSYQGPYGYVIE